MAAQVRGHYDPTEQIPSNQEKASDFFGNLLLFLSQSAINF